MGDGDGASERMGDGRRVTARGDEARTARASEWATGDGRRMGGERATTYAFFFLSRYFLLAALSLARKSVSFL